MALEGQQERDTAVSLLHHLPLFYLPSDSGPVINLLRSAKKLLKNK